MNQIHLDDFVIDVVRKNIKTIRLGVYPAEGSIRISSPIKVKDDTLKSFAESHLDWIKKQLAKFKHIEKPQKLHYISGETHYLWGKPYILNIVEFSRPSVFLTTTHINLYVRPNTSLEKRASYLQEWYRGHLHLEIERLMPIWEEQIGVTANSWQTRSMTSRWGSCNIQKKHILINLELAKKSINCLEYIIVHELVHLLERYHNKRFYGFMSKFMPEWKLHRGELNHRGC